MDVAFTASVLNRRDVAYFSCPQCRFLRTEKPDWLAEAYSRALAAADTGVVCRNLQITKQLACVLFRFFQPAGRFLDTAGGTGLLVRLMRDIGFDFRWEDPYCENALAHGFEAQTGEAGFEAVTAFEALEHMEDPDAFVSGCLRRSRTKTLIFTTELFEGAFPSPDWWYYSFPTGQHISFFSRQTLEHLAHKHGVRLLSYRGLHMFTSVSITQAEYRRVLDRADRIEPSVRKKMQSRMMMDHETMLRRPNRMNGTAAPAAGANGFGTPIVLLIFNRPKLTRDLFDRVSELRPRKLLIIADGPRAARPGEDALCREARAVVETIDWPCEVLRNYSDANMGCRARVSSGLDWAFSLVEEAIILEDDCMPSRTFFEFCAELLARYRAEDQLMMISGNNFLPAGTPVASSYYFSRYPHIWGWATWRRAWQRYDVGATRWPELRDSGWLERLLPGDSRIADWKLAFDSVHSGRLDTWDYQWVLSCWIHGGLAAVPFVNLVRNQGFASDATHTTDHRSADRNREAHELAFPVLHPATVARSEALDRIETEALCRPSKPVGQSAVVRTLRRWRRSIAKRLPR